jgi:hypothetical protein
MSVEDMPIRMNPTSAVQIHLHEVDDPARRLRGRAATSRRPRCEAMESPPPSFLTGWPTRPRTRRWTRRPAVSPPPNHTRPAHPAWATPRHGLCALASQLLHKDDVQMSNALRRLRNSKRAV